MSNQIDRAKLRELAERAETFHSDFTVRRGPDFIRIGAWRVEHNALNTCDDELCDCAEYAAKYDAQAEYIAAANPHTVLALLDELDACETRIAKLREALRRIDQCIPDTDDVFDHRAIAYDALGIDDEACGE